MGSAAEGAFGITQHHLLWGQHGQRPGPGSGRQQGKGKLGEGEPRDEEQPAGEHGGGQLGGDVKGGQGAA